MTIGDAAILVTGGAGLIGSATIDLLLNDHQPKRIIVLDNLSRGSRKNLDRALADSRVTFVEGDVRDRPLVEHLTASADAVVHLAALRITACASEPTEAFDVMCQGAYNVVDCARHAGVRKLVVASTASVYGLADTFPTPEEHHPYNNRTWYGASKLMLEGMLRSFSDMYGLRYVALRYFNVYGPRMDVEGRYTEVMIRWMERLEAGGRPVIFGDGADTMDFVYIDDVARANVLALQADVSDEVCNIGSGTETSLKDLARKLSDAMGRVADVEYQPKRHVNPVPRRLAATEKAERLLGFRATVPLDEGLRRLVAWWRRQGVHA